ncbi:TVP38/TMEM64 family protein [Plastorhodobacter daqingensis]|uniref:TVP38/TMEM64 family membrane protein n=1 Tax=Plastorhodobacter daqingensis TaxID=1387281 RepID=A0ABW2UI10_9RHOB
MRHWRKVPLVLLVVAALSAAVLLRDQLDPSLLREHHEALERLRDDHYLVLSLAFVAAYVAIVVCSLPALVATLSGGLLFGLGAGLVLNVTAATIGAALLFLAVRSGLGARCAARLDAHSGRARGIVQRMRENEVQVLLLLRLVPAVPFVVANVLPALVGVGTARFIATTAVGIIPGTAVYTWVGAGLSEVLARGETPNLSILREHHVLGPLLALCLLAALPIAVRLWRGRKAA